MTERARRNRIVGSALTAALALSGVAFAGDPDQPQHRQTQQSQQQPPEQQTQQRTERRTSEQSDQVQPVSGHDQQQVKELQRELSRRGFYQGRIDGVHGPKTTAALRNFQSQNGIESSGQLDQATSDALGLNAGRQPVSGSEQASPQGSTPQGEQGTTAERNIGQQPGGSSEIMLSNIGNEQGKQLQQRLKELGFYKGQVDGVVGPQTRAALQRFFQRQAELAAQGKFTQPAMGALGIERSEQQPVGGSDQGTRAPAEEERSTSPGE